MFFSKNKKQISSKSSLICDIGNGSVALAYVEYTEPIPTVTHKVRIDFPAVESSSYSVLLEIMLRTFDTALHQITHLLSAQRTQLSSSQVLCFLSSPWAQSEARSIEYVQQNDKEVTHDMLRNIKQTLIDEVKQSLVSDSKTYQVMMSEFSGISLNGYKVKNPLHKKARSISLTGFVSIVEKTVKDRITSVIRSHSGISQPVFIPSLYAYYRGVEKIVAIPPDYVFYDVSAETTDMSIVRDEQLCYTALIPFGVASIPRKLSKIWNTSIQDATGRIGLYEQNLLSGPARLSVKEALSSIQEEWESSLRECIFEASQYGVMPATVLYATLPGKDFLAKGMILGDFSSGSSLKPLKSSSGMFFERDSWFHVISLPLAEHVRFVSQDIDPFIALAILGKDIQVKDNL